MVMWELQYSEPPRKGTISLLNLPEQHRVKHGKLNPASAGFVSFQASKLR